jgi:hypothetical protein
MGLVLLTGLAGIARAQDQAPAQLAPIPIPIKVTVTISRFQGDKRISSLPYSLSINVPPVGPPNQPLVGRAGAASASLRMGSRVPIVAPASGTTPASVNYQDVGTGIDCSIHAPTSDGRFRLDVTIDESSITDDPAGKDVVQVGRPTFRSFRTSDSLMLRDGQSKELAAIPDKLTGEVVKVDVAIMVVK